MRKMSAVLLIFLLVLSLCLPAQAARQVIVTPATGYQDADDVQYKTYSQSGKQVIANWGARGETCTFLSSYAEDYYTNSYTWDTMSQLSGGTSTSNTPSSALYKQLKSLMSSTHTFYTYYDGNQNVRNFYKYTDCVRSDTSKVSLFYFGTLVTSSWNSGKIWNQEHVWPKSKLSNSQQIGDIMHLRPADPGENTKRSNTAYGESSGYYDPGLGVRGDCARMMLYMYVRWGATSTMWGSTGVMENLNILLKWMEEDPVDTWEMGRNDSVQSITGTRNVFVDYPEYAWLLFGREIPEDMVTPSGEASAEQVCTHKNQELRNKIYEDCTRTGYTGDTYCLDCGECIATGTTVPATGHLTTVTENQVDATCTTGGYTGDVYCYDCDEYISTGTIIPATGHLATVTENQVDATCTTGGYTGDVYCYDCDEYISTGTTIAATGHRRTQLQNKADATCGKDGNTGDLYCLDCKTIIMKGIRLPATGKHEFSDWLLRPGGGHKDRVCQVCGYVETEQVLPSCEHVSEYIVTIQPTCTTEGWGGNFCNKCTDYLGGGKEIPATGHQHTEIRNKADANCTTDGYTGDTYCTDCNTKIAAGEVIPATGHQHTEIRNKADANCTTDGYTGDTYCTDCNTKTAAGEVIPATGHQHTEIRNKADANCTTDGYTGDTYCTDCNTKTAAGEVIPATGHQHTEIRNKADANCTTDGYTGDTYCTDCNTKTAAGEVIPATGHQHTEIRNKADANCTTDGYTGDTYCTDCNTKTAEGERISATGHQNTEVRNKADANCTTDGYTGDTYCTDCNTKTAEGEVIPATGHGDVYHQNQKDATCSTDGHTGDVYCVDCDQLVSGGSVIPATGHLHTEIRGQKDATCAEVGSTGDTYCADCNTKIAEGEIIPATGAHVYGDPAPGGGRTFHDCTLCGHREYFDTDNCKPGPNWVAIGIAAAAVVVVGGGIAAIVIIKKRKR